MANEINALIHPVGEAVSGILATGSVVAGDFLFAYQTSTDDMYAASDSTAFTAGSLAVQRVARATGENEVVGIALNNASSGDTLSIATEGVFIGISQGGVTPGFKVMNQGQGVIDYNLDASGGHYVIGRALTGASAASKYVAFKLSL